MVGTFPLNVQAGSPQYTLASEITPASSTTTITVTIPNTGSTDPISNAYYTIQNEDGSKWCTFYVESWTNVGGFVPADAPVTYNLSCTYTSSNTSDAFPEGSICWCIWCKEYYDSLITQIGGGGNTIKVSQLEWDTNLVIPAGKAIESASGDVNITGNLIVSDKQLVIGQNVGNASVKLAQPNYTGNYTSSDFTITARIEGVQYIVPAITYRCSSSYYTTGTFTLQAKVGGAYQSLSQYDLEMKTPSGGSDNIVTQPAVLPVGATALRYVISVKGGLTSSSIASSLTLTLTPIPVY